MIKTAAASLLLVAAFGPVRSKAEPLEHLPALAGDYFEIQSAVVGRPYHIYVRLPADYAKTDRLYPTVYLLDGDSLFPMLGALHLFLTYDEKTPEAIIVGIAYGAFDPAINKRDVDFRAPPGDDGDKAGGAARFQRFLGAELIPEIEKRYRSDRAERVLVGQSHGGQFVLYSALTAPDMFRGRIASNPSMKPNVEFFYGAADRPKRHDLKLFFASGSRDREHLRAEALKWSASWADREKPWALRFETIEGGTHAASIPEVYRRGMLWLFEDKAPPSSPK
ncbi:MAG: hypothetical protein K2Q06_11085 [Parvularculaceae bacterium]|nr:hypothetical protein [Parvularculaceae bacterium]